MQSIRRRLSILTDSVLHLRAAYSILYIQHTVYQFTSISTTFWQEAIQVVGSRAGNFEKMQYARTAYCKILLKTRFFIRCTLNQEAHKIATCSKGAQIVPPLGADLAVKIERDPNDAGRTVQGKKVQQI